MLRNDTPVEDHTSLYGLLVKREDLSCPPPGPPFSKMRGVLAHIKTRPESVIGVLDTRHSQAGHAVAYACKALGKGCANFYPDFKAALGEIRGPQQRSRELGAELFPLTAGRSAVLYHRAKKACVAAGAYLMPNALKLEESVNETATEVLRSGDIIAQVQTILISASSGTIAAGVLRGLSQMDWHGNVIIHMGYSRSKEAVLQYMIDKAGDRLKANPGIRIQLYDEGYAYAQEARRGANPPWPCNVYYDLKAFRWWMLEGWPHYRHNGPALMWNVG